MIFRWSKKYEVLFLTMRSEVGGKDATVFFAVHQLREESQKHFLPCLQ